MIVTADDLRRCTKRLKMHMRLGKGGYMLQYQCVEHPALYIAKFKSDRTKPVQISMSIDGEETPWDIEKAADALTWLYAGHQAALKEAVNG